MTDNRGGSGHVYGIRTYTNQKGDTSYTVLSPIMPNKRNRKSLARFDNLDEARSYVMARHKEMGLSDGPVMFKPESWDRKDRGQSSNILYRECADCGGWFKAIRSNALYCSDKCKSRAQRQKKETPWSAIGPTGPSLAEVWDLLVEQSMALGDVNTKVDKLLAEWGVT